MTPPTPFNEPCRRVIRDLREPAEPPRCIGTRYTPVATSLTVSDDLKIILSIVAVTYYVLSFCARRDSPVPSASDQLIPSAVLSVDLSPCDQVH